MSNLNDNNTAAPVGIRRRDSLATGVAVLGASLLGFPAILRAQPAPVKLGLVHPVTGFIAFAGAQCRAGALMAIADINAAGGIKSLGGAKLEALLGDSQGRPEAGAAEVSKLVEAGAHGIVGGFSSSLSLATTQAAARTNTPHVVDTAVADEITARGLGNTFRLSPGHSNIVGTAVANLNMINKSAGSPARSAMIIHEESATGTGSAKLLVEQLPKIGIEVLGVIKHANPTRDFTNIALQVKSKRPDIVIPGNFYNEYVLLARTLRQQQVSLKAIYSVLGGAASSPLFVRDFPQVAESIIDCNHWFNPKSNLAQQRKKAAEDQGVVYTYEVFVTYNAVAFLADAIERAGSTSKEAINAALASSTWDKHGMPYGPTKMRNGQNTGAQAINTQVLKGVIEAIFPRDFATAQPIFPTA